MAKKVIQVPVDSELLAALDQLSKKQRRARSDLIRRACLRYLKEIEDEDLDTRYQNGYLTNPEESDAGEAQVVLASEFMPKESW